jgi:glyoxylase-like metal-dependent hydrolase (beta-lactamase superfamily II)
MPMRVKRFRKKQLPLSNKGELQLFPVGCGSAFSKRLYQNNWLVLKGDTHVMVDCGTRAPEALFELGRPVTDISTWLITHSHADHIGGLEEVMLMSRYVARKKPSVIITPEYQETLWNFSLRGGSEPNEQHDGEGLGFTDFWEVIRPAALDGYPRDTCEITLGNLNIKLVRTHHFPEQAAGWKDSAYSVGLILDDRILFTGDTQFDRELLESYDERFHFEHIFHDVQFFTGGVHAGLEELMTLPPPLRSRMYLMHYADSWREHESRVREAGFAGFVRQQHFYTFH